MEVIISLPNLKKSNNKESVERNKIEIKGYIASFVKNDSILKISWRDFLGKKILYIQDPGIYILPISIIIALK